MKKTFIIILTVVLAFVLCSCGGKSVISYEETPSVTYAENLYNTNFEQYKEFCSTMAGNNDDKQERDNFFNYVLVKAATVDSENAESEYINTLDYIAECLKLPLTQHHVVNGLKSIYNSIDTKLTEKSKQYMLGKWRRVDASVLSGAAIEVYINQDGEYESKFTGLPDAETTSYKIGDIKWKNLQFANYKTVYLQDLVNFKINTETYYKSDDKTVSEYKGATGQIMFEQNKIVIVYDSKGISDTHQTWEKIE